jgi:hypothetical protein
MLDKKESQKSKEDKKKGFFFHKESQLALVQCRQPMKGYLTAERRTLFGQMFRG